jgi:hypothetical protein
MSFFGFLGNVLKGGISIATHGIINLGGSGGGSGGVPSASALPAASQFSRFAGGSVLGGGMPTFSPLRGFSAAGPGTGGGGSALLPHFACDRGQHHKKPQTKAERHAWFASKCVTNRRMNVANPKALRRSIRRLYGAEKMYARLLRVTHPHKIARGRVHPKPPRRRRT